MQKQKTNKQTKQTFQTFGLNFQLFKAESLHLTGDTNETQLIAETFFCFVSSFFF